MLHTVTTAVSIGITADIRPRSIVDHIMHAAAGMLPPFIPERILHAAAGTRAIMPTPPAMVLVITITLPTIAVMPSAADTIASIAAATAKAAAMNTHTVMLHRATTMPDRRTTTMPDRRRATMPDRRTTTMPDRRRATMPDHRITARGAAAKGLTLWGRHITAVRLNMPAGITVHRQCTPRVSGMAAVVTASTTLMPAIIATRADRANIIVATAKKMVLDNMPTSEPHAEGLPNAFSRQR